MAKVMPGRWTADIEGDFVVFLIGMRINKLWQVNKWWRVARAMPPMMRAQISQPEIGMLGMHSWIGWRTTLLVQYWRSVEDLQRFAKDPALPHHPAWRNFNQAIYRSEAVGIWHETFLVKAGQYETIYGHMPRFGLAVAGAHVPIARKGDTAAQRLAGDPTAPAGEDVRSEA